MKYLVCNNQMKNLIVTCALATLLAVVGCGGASSDIPKYIATPTPIDIATATPIFSEGEILALVQQWVMSTCSRGSLVDEMMSENRFSGEYLGDNSWRVGVRHTKDNFTEYFTVYEQSRLVEYLVQNSSGRKTSFDKSVC